jgi:hypothetical protein
MIRLQTCPICEKSVPPASDPSGGMSPFCSLRCKQVDFFRWADGRYAIIDPCRPTEFDAESAPQD